MAELIGRQTQFDYRDKDLPNRKDEPTGEPESLVGRIKRSEMGTYATREKAPLQGDEKKTAGDAGKKKKAGSVGVDLKKKSKLKKSLGKLKNNVLDADVDDTILYRPKTKENKYLYEQIMESIHKILQDTPRDVLHSYTDEVLAVLKNDSIKDQQKKSEIEAVLGHIKDQLFDKLLNLAKQINDYQAQVEEQFQKRDQEVVMTLDPFDQQEEEEDENLQDVSEKSSGQSEVDEDEKHITTKSKKMQEIVLDDEDSSNSKIDIPVEKIGAYWLQSELQRYYNDPHEAQQIEQQLLRVLNIENDIECEDELVKILDFERFQLVSMLVQNRHKVYYCTILGQAQTQQERETIMNEMKNNEIAESILEAIENSLNSETSGLTGSSGRFKFDSKLREKGDDGQMDNEGDDLQNIIEAQNIPQQEFAKMSKKVLNLSDLSFAQGAHVNSNEQVNLPKGSFSISKKGYEEIFIPAVKVKNDDTKIIKISELPKYAQPVFEGIDKLNPIQSRVYETAMFKPNNMLICAPTGAGQTNIALLAMLQIIGTYINNDGSIDKSKFKIVYISPMKALVSEQVGSFSKRLSKLGINVKELTGDSNLSKEQIQDTQVIIATPEKWDIVTRQSGDRAYTELVRLMIIDEIHLLHDMRGPVLESLIARTIRNIESTQEMVRIVGLSATLPNYADVATFIRADPKIGLFYFDYSYRPCPLEQQYIGFTEKQAVRRTILMNQVLYEKVMERAGKYQMIIFVHSRRETAKTANMILEMATAKDELNQLMREDSDSKKVVSSIVQKEKINNKDLKSLLEFGIGIHHAGLARGDRDLVEDLFASRHLQVLVSTATLAWGVNLPAHTIIIKGTQIYSPEQGRWAELSPQDILQMMGRAGRPGYDTKGEGIIMTGYAELKFYLSLNNMQLPIESQFISSLADQLNAEIVLNSVSNLKDAVTWLGYTFLYVRMLRNPGLYGISQQQLAEDRLLVRRRSNLVHSAALLLDKANLIKYDKKTGAFTVTSLGKISSHYYIKHGSMSVYNENLKPNMGVIELFRLFSLSHEFQFIPIREEEKGELQKLYESVPIPIKGSSEDPSTKINVLLQAYVARLETDGYALNSDMIFVTQSASRIMRALYEMSLRRGWANVSETALAVCKMIDKRMWNCMTPLRQFKLLPEEILKRIEKKEQFTFDHLYTMNPKQLGDLVKFDKMGKVLHQFIHQFPQLDLQPYVQPITRSCLKIELTIDIDFQWDSKIHGRSQAFWIFITDCDGDQLLYSEYITIQGKDTSSKEHVYQIIVPLFQNMHPLYFIKVVSDRWLQCESVIPIPFKNLILPLQFEAPTQQLDLQPQPVSTLHWLVAEKILGFKEFNPIQTQVCKTFISAKDNIFLGASKGMGKKTMALLSIMKILRDYPTDLIIFVSPIESECLRLYEQWVERLKPLSAMIGLLTGQLNTDLQIIERSNLIITSPEAWDTISRKWTTRKLFKRIRLFVANDLHMISEAGSVYEVIVSRMRYISTQLGQNIQIIGLATSVADYMDMARWIGCQPANTFNFHPNVRANPLEIIIQGFEQVHRKSRVLSMHQQLYHALKNMFDRSNQAKGVSFNQLNSILVFVSDKKQARLSALDIMTLCSNESFIKEKFLNISKTELATLLTDVNDHILSHVLTSGIGYIYQGQSQYERNLCLELFERRSILLLISTYQEAWNITQKAETVVILDNQRYDGAEQRYIDYTIPDMLQMMGHAYVDQKKISNINAHGNKSSQNQQQQSEKKEPAQCLVFCQAPKQDFYKKFLFEPYPVESHLNHYMHNHICAEIVVRTIKSIPDCIDWITWTFMYHRLSQNPNYYNLQELSEESMNTYICDLVEKTVEDLVRMKCVTEEEDRELIAVNLGIICSFYYINTSTIEVFSSQVKEDSKLRNLIEIVANASEFDVMPLRHGEDSVLELITQEVKSSSSSTGGANYFSNVKIDLNNPNFKTYLLLLAHFTRTSLPTDIAYDQKFVLDKAVRITHSLVDFISSHHWLSLAVKTMQLSQMIVQAMFAHQSPLLQLPHFTQEIVDKFKKNQINDIADLMNMEDEERDKLFQGLDKSQVEDIAKFANQYPTVSMEFQVVDQTEIRAADDIVVSFTIEREGDQEDLREVAHAPYYPQVKQELWWIMVGDKENNVLHSIKRFSFKPQSQQEKFDLKFTAQEQPGSMNLFAYLICDSYIGCDQSQPFKINVLENLDVNQMGQ